MLCVCSEPALANRRYFRLYSVLQIEEARHSVVFCRAASLVAFPSPALPARTQVKKTLCLSSLLPSIFLCENVHDRLPRQALDKHTRKAQLNRKRVVPSDAGRCTPDINCVKGTNPGRTHRFYTGTAVVPFGTGLSYTEFTYGIADAPAGVVSLAPVREMIAQVITIS